MVVGAFGPYSLGLPKPCRETSSNARSSLSVISHAWPDDVQLSRRRFLPQPRPDRQRPDAPAGARIDRVRQRRRHGRQAHLAESAERAVAVDERDVDRRHLLRAQDRVVGKAALDDRAVLDGDGFTAPLLIDKRSPLGRSPWRGRSEQGRTRLPFR